MTDKVKKRVRFRFDRYKDLEIKLEKYAAKGLFLEACSGFMWTFKKGEPKKVTYTVTYFSEGSLFNPDITDNQQTYIDYAEAAGWHFIAQLNQLQIFCSDDETVSPFETDEREKFDNIKNCMKKSFLLSTIVSLLVFLLNLAVLFNTFRLDPIGFLSNATLIFSTTMLFSIVLYDIYLLIDYAVWCKRSEKSIALGGKCIEGPRLPRRIIEMIFMLYILGSAGWLLFHIISERSWLGFFISILQIPILAIVFWSSITYLKKKNTSALKNKVISYTLLAFSTIAYLVLMMTLIFSFNFNLDRTSDFRTVTWQLTASESHDYRLYNDEIPLTCEDLYGPLDYDYYSYEETADSTLFLTKNSYRQDALPAKDAPQRIAYDILKPQFDFAYALVKSQLLAVPQWRQEELSHKSIDNEIFGTTKAYQDYFDNDPTGTYILFFKDKIITLNLEKPATTEQIAVIKEKLIR